MSLVIVGTTKYVGFNGSIALQSKEEHLYKVCYLLSLDLNIAEYSPRTFLLARRDRIWKYSSFFLLFASASYHMTGLSLWTE